MEGNAIVGLPLSRSLGSSCSRRRLSVRAEAASAPPLNKYSSRITQPKSQGASQAMLYATGLKQEDLAKAQVGISSVWYEGNSCNMHLMDLAAAVKEGVQAAGLARFPEPPAQALS